jgi:hypothetical protein
MTVFITTDVRTSNPTQKLDVTETSVRYSVAECGFILLAGAVRRDEKARQ